MKMLPILIVALVTSVATGQTQYLSPDMVEAAKKVHDAFEQNLKGWKRTDVRPFGNDSNIIVENWERGDRRARVSVALMREGVDNDAWLADFLKRDTRAKRLEGIGDAAAVWGYADASVTFHSGRFNVSVNGTTDLRLWGSMSSQNAELNRSESAATARLIACFLNMALNGDLQPGKHGPRNPLTKRPCEMELVNKGLLSPDLFREF